MVEVKGSFVAQVFQGIVGLINYLIVVAALVDVSVFGFDAVDEGAALHELGKVERGAGR